MADQEQTTTEMTQTETTEATSITDTGSDTSTTQTGQETVDLSKTAETETETKTDEIEETEEQKAEREERETLFGAPAEGEAYKLEGLPEGTVVDEEALADIAPIARQLGLSNKGLSAVAGVYAEKILPRVAQQVSGQIEQDIVAKRTEWENEARDAISGKTELKNAAGEILGFNKEPMESVRQTAAKALDKLAPQDFRTFLDETGLAVHPAMVAFAYQAGKLIAEDREIETTETTKDRPTSAAEKRKSGGLDSKKFYNR